MASDLQPVTIPNKVLVTLAGNAVTVKGPKGELTARMHPAMTITQESGVVKVARPDDERQNRALHGLTRALINNMVRGVSTGFRKTLAIAGVGYRAEMNGKKLVLYLGYSHPIDVEPPEGISFAIDERGTIVHVDGADRQAVGVDRAVIDDQVARCPVELPTHRRVEVSEQLVHRDMRFI